MKALSVVLAAFLLISFSATAEDGPAEQLQELESRIEKTPDDPMLSYRKAQCLMKLGRREEGYQTAKEASQRYGEETLSASLQQN